MSFYHILSKQEYEYFSLFGRALRLAENKEQATIIDIIDDLCYKKHQNFTFKHGIQRLKIYSEEMFNTQYEKIDL